MAPWQPPTKRPSAVSACCTARADCTPRQKMSARSCGRSAACCSTAPSSASLSRPTSCSTWLMVGGGRCAQLEMRSSVCGHLRVMSRRTSPGS
eukprot:2182920-Prymnesium_polylepis.1